MKVKDITTLWDVPGITDRIILALDLREHREELLADR